MRMMKIVDKILSPRAIFLAGALVIIVACFVAYLPAIKGGFIWDDDIYVTDNPLLTAPHGLYHIWFTMNGCPPPQFVPLVYATIYTTFWAEHQLWGFNPAGYHAVNVAVHIANALLLWLVLRRLSIPWAWFASAVFALHPVQVESVAWITELKNTMMVFFSLLTVLCWMEFTVFERSGRRAYVRSLLLYALSLLSKSTACTLPAAFVLILWLKRVPLTAKRLLQIVPFVAMGIGTGFLVMWREQRLGTGFLNLGLGPAEKLLIAGRALWFYLWKLFWPVNLTFSYPRWNIDPTAIRQYAWPVAFVLALACAWLLRKRMGRAPLAALLFFALTLFPMLGFFSLYTFVYTFVADHYQYAACIGPIAIVSAGAAILFGRSGKNVKFVITSAAGILLLTLAILTWRQCGIYKNSNTLWADTLNKNPDSFMAHGQIGVSLCKQGKYNEAIPHFEQHLKIVSHIKTVTPLKLASSYSNMGLALQNLGRLDEAVACYQNSLDIWEHSAYVHYLLGVVLAQKGNVERARLHFLRAIEIIKDKNELFSGVLPKNKDQIVEAIYQQLILLEKKNKSPINQKGFQ